MIGGRRLTQSTAISCVHIARKKKLSNYVYSLRGTPLKAMEPATYLGFDITKQ